MADRKRILIVDDELHIREVLGNYFRFLGYDVLVAGNGKDALDVMMALRCDVVISDIIMPVMDGVELLRNIREHYPMCHCVMITGYVTQDNVLACMKYGADTCVFKPLDDMKELEEAVARAFDQIEHWQRKLKELTQMKP